MGSNLGDRLARLRRAARVLETVLSGLRFSPVYETLPVGLTEQPKFLNLCCTGDASLAALDLLARLKELEREAGRLPAGPRFGPRPLDLDILLYGREIVDTEDLTIPHPRLHERAFVLVPLSDIAPEWAHPVLGATIGELRREVNETGVVRTPWSVRRSTGTRGGADGGAAGKMEG